MSNELHLRPGVQASVAVNSLRDLIMQGGNVVSSAGGVDITFVQRLQNAYLSWVEGVEHALRTHFASPWVWEPLYGARWAEIRNLVRASPRPHPLVADEVRSQCDRLTEILHQLENSQVHFELAVGCVAIVPDTNVFLHYTFFKDLDWVAHVRTVDATVTDVRLVVPSVIVDQLDDQSYKPQPRADRAKAVLRELRQLQEGLPSPEAPAAIRAHVDIQLLVDAPGHAARRNDDDEILTRAEYVAALVGDRVHIATGDLGMQTRAVMRGLKCLVLPLNLRLDAGGRTA